MLVSLAHPDDESFGMAGTIARYVNEGVEVSLICATNGDAGVTDPAFLENYDTMTELRLAELQCAADALGFSRVYAFGYRDSGMEGTEDNLHPDSLYQADLEEVTGRVVKAIRETRPQVVVTFDPYGSYGHPDHIKMHQATTRAFELAGQADAYPEQLTGGLEPYQPAKLYYRTRPRMLTKLVVRLMPLFGQDPRRMGRNNDIDLIEIVEHDYPVHAWIDTKAYRKQAEKAVNCHASQLGGFVTPSFLQRVQALLMNSNVDTFMRVEPPVNGARVREDDLFAGIAGA
jgi:LmbE family N-acetylglucosaminyl deacetylase